MPRDGGGEPPVAVGDPPQVTVWTARLTSGERTLSIRLAPWHADGERQSFEARALRERLGLPAGEPFRLELGVEGGSDEALEFDASRIAISGPATSLSVPPSSGSAGSVGALLSAPPGRLGTAAALQLALWGPAPADERLALSGLSAAFPGVDQWELVRDTVRADRLPRSLAQLALAQLAHGQPADGGAEVAAATALDDPAPSPASLGFERDGVVPTVAVQSGIDPSGDGQPGQAQSRIDELEGLVAELQRELNEVQDKRLEREMAWVAHTRLLSSLDDLEPLADQLRVVLDLPPAEPLEGVEPDGETASGPVEDPGVVAAREASARRAQRLNLLLRAEGVWGLELMEAGELIYPANGGETAGDGVASDEIASDEIANDEIASDATADDAIADGAIASDGPDLSTAAELSEPGEELLSAVSAHMLEEVDGPRSIDELVESAPHPVGTGPVVFRLIDDDGRLAGSLYAERLALVGSRAGRSLTLVLEQGYRSEGGSRVPFSDGVHRIALRHVDPEPFMESLPELFAAEDLDRAIDDGRWSLPMVRATLNGLLEREPAGASYRLAWLGGIVGDEWRDVHFELLDEAGRPRRHVFADTMRLTQRGSTVTVELRDGTTVRGDEKAPFLDGRMRIVIPRANESAWGAAALPGLAPAPIPSTP